MASVVRDGSGRLPGEALSPNHNETVLDEALFPNHNETVLDEALSTNHNETVLAG